MIQCEQTEDDKKRSTSNITMPLKDATAACERYLDGRDDEERGGRSVKPKLTVRKMVDIGTLEVQRTEPNVLGGKLMSELTIRAVVPRGQEAETREKFQSALEILID